MTLSEFLALAPRGDLWIFGYGSLMWSPGFRCTEKSAAKVHGYHRSLCVYSHRYRGTVEQPGLVMGLCRGGSCWGMAFRVAAAQAPRVLANLWWREMRNRVYEARFVPVRIHSHVTELGQLELWCASTASDHRWKLEFRVREDAEE